MKTILALLTLTLLSSCVQQSIYDELKTDNEKLKEQLERSQKELMECYSSQADAPKADLTDVEKIEDLLRRYSLLKTSDVKDLNVGYNENTNTLIFQDFVYNLNDLIIKYEFSKESKEHYVQFRCKDGKDCFWQSMKNSKSVAAVNIPFISKRKCDEFIDLIYGLKDKYDAL